MTIPHRHNALLGKPVADEIITSVKSGVAELSARGWPTKLVSVTIGDVPAINLYVRNQARGADMAAEGVQQVAVRGGVHQRTVVVLAVNLHQRAADLAHQRHARRSERGALRGLESQVHGQEFASGRDGIQRPHRLRPEQEGLPRAG